MARFDDTIGELRLSVGPGELERIAGQLRTLAERVPAIVQVLKEANTTAYLNTETGLCTLGNANVPEVQRLSTNMTNTYLAVFASLTAAAESLQHASGVMAAGSRDLGRATGRLRPT
jgi:hypothetical protein